jgi:hypothetical protein
VRRADTLPVRPAVHHPVRPRVARAGAASGPTDFSAFYIARNFWRQARHRLKAFELTEAEHAAAVATLAAKVLEPSEEGLALDRALAAVSKNQEKSDRDRCQPRDRSPSLRNPRCCARRLTLQDASPSSRG